MEWNRAFWNGGPRTGEPVAGRASVALIDYRQGAQCFDVHRIPPLGGTVGCWISQLGISSFMIILVFGERPPAVLGPKPARGLRSWRLLGHPPAPDSKRFSSFSPGLDG